MPRKLKVVDISTENNQETLDNDEVTETPNEDKPIENEPVETVNEIIQETTNEEEVKEEKDSGSGRPTETHEVGFIPEPVKEEVKEPTRKIKTSELVQCPRCNRWMTEKNIKICS